MPGGLAYSTMAPAMASPRSPSDCRPLPGGEADIANTRAITIVASVRHATSRGVLPPDGNGPVDQSGAAHHPGPRPSLAPRALGGAPHQPEGLGRFRGPPPGDASQPQARQRPWTPD